MPPVRKEYKIRRAPVRTPPENWNAKYPIPYDPEGYLARLKNQVPKVDEVILRYAQEAVQTFLRGNLLGSSVMLGVASEKAVLLLMDGFAQAITNTSRKNRFERKMERSFSILTRFRLLRKELKPLKKPLRIVADDLDIQLDGVFNLIRHTRNDAGHPTGKEIDRSLAYANLQLFIPYCQLIYLLIEYFEQNQVL